MHALALLLLVVAVFCLVYAIERQIRRDVKHYMSSINDQTGRGLAELFLFIDVRRIWPCRVSGPY